MAFIEVEALEHTYLQGTPFAVQVLKGVDLSIDEGELVGIVGPSRAGKSTLAQFFNGLLLPVTGRVSVGGVDLGAKKVDLMAVRRQVGLVFQYPEHQLFAETVGEDVSFGPGNLGLAPDEVSRRVAESLAAVGLEPGIYLDRPIHALSGGQKRRAAIAGVLALEPDVLVLDDPIAGLDPRGRDSILSWIVGLRRERGLTVVLISNSLEEIAPLVERVVVMSDGRVAADGSPGSVFSDVELLERVGLGTLHTTRLMMAARERGYEVSLEPITDTAVARELAPIFAEGSRRQRESARGAR